MIIKHVVKNESQLFIPMILLHTNCNGLSNHTFVSNLSLNSVILICLFVY